MVYQTLRKSLTSITFPPLIGSVPQIADVYAIYELVYNNNEQDLWNSKERKESATMLLSVILSAQEPLPLSLLQQLCLDTALEWLPGSGFFFFVSEHKVYMLHKSLADWLRTKVDLVQGHATLGLYLAKSRFSCLARNKGRSLLRSLTLKSSHFHLIHCLGKLECETALIELATDFHFIEAVLAAGHCPLLISSLSQAMQLALRPEFYSRQDNYLLASICRDVQLWLTTQLQRLQKDPDASRHITMVLQDAPMTSHIYQAALKASKVLWKPLLVMPTMLMRWNSTRTIADFHQRDGVSTQGGCVCFSFDGKQVLTCADDGLGRIWEASSGEQLAVLRGHGEKLSSCAWSPDGSYLVTGGESSIHVWDVATGQTIKVSRGVGGGVTCLSFRPCSSLFAAGCLDGKIYLFDSIASFNSEDGRLLGSKDMHPLTTLDLDPPFSVHSIAWSSDGEVLVSGHDDGWVRIWTIESRVSGRCSHSFRGGLEAKVVGISLRPFKKEEGKDCIQIVLLGSDIMLRVWEIDPGSFRRSIMGGSTGTLDDEQLPSSWRQVFEMREDSRRMFSVAHCPGGGDRFAVGSEICGIRVFESNPPYACLYVHWTAGPVYSVSWNPSSHSRQLACLEHTRMALFDASFEHTETEMHWGWVAGLAWSSDSKYLVTCGNADQTVRIWDPEPGHVKGSRANRSVCKIKATDYGEVRCVDCYGRIEDGWIASADDSEVTIWGAISRDGKIFDHDGKIFDHEFIASITPPGWGKIWSIKFNPHDGLKLAAAYEGGVFIATASGDGGQSGEGRKAWRSSNVIPLLRPDKDYFSA